MKDPVYPDDFQGWKPLYPIHNNKYIILESPDGTRETCIHLLDNEIIGIIDRATGVTLYDGNLAKAEELGLTGVYNAWKILVG